MPGADYEAGVLQRVHEAGHVAWRAADNVAELALGERASAVKQPNDRALIRRSALETAQVF
jgi:hypothetical protein